MIVNQITAEIHIIVVLGMLGVLQRCCEYFTLTQLLSLYRGLISPSYVQSMAYE